MQSVFHFSIIIQYSYLVCGTVYILVSVIYWSKFLYISLLRIRIIIYVLCHHISYLDYKIVPQPHEYFQILYDMLSNYLALGTASQFCQFANF